MILHPKRPFVVWLTGLSAAGKTTTAVSLLAHFQALGLPMLHLDGDDLRILLCNDLSFGNKDRLENNRRAAAVALIAAKSGFSSICSLISPFAAARNSARELIESAGFHFIEVYVKASIEVCRERDPKGLYVMSDEGTMKNLTGIQSPYEVPESPDLILETNVFGVTKCRDLLAERLEQLGCLS